MKRKLIIHVGMGKTGSSSIQKTLRVARPALEEYGIKYLGLMLEHLSLPRTQYEWHAVDGWGPYMRMDKAQANRELAHALQYADDHLSTQLHTLIWSNESLFDRFKDVQPALEAIQGRYDIHVIGYIRRPDSWIVSAYLQWGIKHKAYRGPLKPFREWVQSKPYVVTPMTQEWTAFTDHARFFNFENISDVSTQFVHVVLGLSDDKIPSLRENDTPPPPAMALFSYHNSLSDRHVLPDEIEPLLQQAGLYEKMQKVQPYNKLLPEESEVSAYVKRSQDEIQKINALFEASGQVVFDLEESRFKNYMVSPLDTNRAMLQLIVHLWREVEALKAELNEMRERND
ncbi:hypothetical protein [Halomonas sp. DN3]|uniref:hypothetical protein n=1 Tax=Halomonas sp. DN3 TaxID=2953657 RepID=UPI00209FEE85|nr:hypothetical protein [Halomonas sp. DN3]USZ49720.1 hypothetical protein NKF27_19925 [Halomonas sp. DN3]